jgi:hypothetical protein
MFFTFLSRADCSNVDKPGGIPEHNGLSKFGKVIDSFFTKIRPSVIKVLGTYFNS